MKLTFFKFDFARYCDRILFWLFRYAVPRPLRRDPILSMRAAISLLLPVLYIFSSRIGFMGQPTSVVPPLWALALYTTFPILAYLLGTDAVSTWGFFLMQAGSSLMLLLRVHPHLSVAVSLIFMPLVIFVLSGPRSGIAVSLLALYVAFASQWNWWPLFHNVLPTMPYEQLGKTVRAGVVRTWTMAHLLLFLHRLMFRIIVHHKTTRIKALERTFAAIWYVFGSFFSCLFFFSRFCVLHSLSCKYQTFASRSNIP